MPDIRHLSAVSPLRFLGVWVLLVCIAGAQQLFPPSRTVEQTRVPVFPDYSPDDKPQELTHPEPLANFRLVMEYRLEKPGDRLALELGPAATLELPPAADGGWRTLQVRHELTGRRKGVFEAMVDGRIVKQASLPPPDGVKPAATFPDGVPGIPVRLTLHTAGNARIRSAWVQPLSQVDHAKHLASWNDKTLAEGKQIYESLCITCHGTMTKEGSLPTSLRFGKQPFKNGSDPFRMHQTISKGYGQMTPMPQYTSAQTYAVIQYIRETFLAPHRPEDMTPVDESYLTSLPVPMTTLRRESEGDRPPPFYHLMDFGTALHWTYQIGPGNIAFKALATRLDPGPGGVIRGNAWIVHDLDTLAVAAVTGGSFVDWRGIAFDGSHGTHTSLTGKRMFANPVGPGWANPADGSWEDPRPLARDGRPYGPLPRAWARHLGTHIHGSEQILRYSVGDAVILEADESLDGVVVRTLNIGRSSRDLKHRIAPVSAKLAIRCSDSLETVEENGFVVLKVPASLTPVNFRIAIAPADSTENLDSSLSSTRLPLDLEPLTHGGPPRWPQVLTTRSVRGEDTGAFAVDALEHPDDAANPWQSRMQLSGFDFFADGKRAAVCTWLGDVWIVEGIDQPAPAELRWRRIASGLFQPLGLKIIDDIIHVTCRDQIARLHDRNNDGETDFIECFNNDHQVTEHFHEFAMGLQADEKGNLYYAKSARHARPALVPHHGTLLRVSADGTRTDILASGLRAANGICLNPDGTFFITDQEGEWTPKNRINLVRGDGPDEFFGNMLGYHNVTDTSDDAMKPPLCWITNRMDRSPAELLWVPREAKWGNLGGSLLNLSYGYGTIYTVPYEMIDGQPQGGVCALPMPPFPTGIMRGRFHPNGNLYACGMFSWAGNRTQPGGFYRVRSTGKPAMQPVGLEFRKGTIRIRFSDPLDPSAADAARHAVRAWHISRTKRYGSTHENERDLTVSGARLESPDTLVIEVPDLEPTRCIEIRCRLKQADGFETERVIHGTIHRL
jgi:cytochrome c5